jgi:ArsR family transcriptional regulator
MDPLLAQLRACAEPTRLRLLALAARGSFCVIEFTEILGQSQPRLSRQLKLLTDAGLLERVREGANVWFTLSAASDLARALLDRLPANDPQIAADARQAARVLAERARTASEKFRSQGADWDEMRALDLPAPLVEQALLALLPHQGAARLLDIGTGTGALLEAMAPRVAQALGVDASRQMLALARARLSRPELAHCAVRQADMYNLPLPDASFDAAVLQMVLHYAEDPAAALAEAARVLRPGGTLVVVDLAAHDHLDATRPLAHRWAGFSDAAMHQFFAHAGLVSRDAVTVPGRLTTRLWPAHTPMKEAA